MSLPKNPSLTPVSQKLRKQMTRQEKHLWYDFLKDHPFQFNRQKVIGPFVVDFFCHFAKLVIEIDGGQHFDAERKQRDTERTNYLRSLGLEVMRFTNREIDHDFFEVCRVIQERVEKLVPRKMDE